MLTLPKILILAVIQGTAELLPVSSSAHVIVAEKLMGLDPTTPQMTLLLVMLHTGTMLAVIVFFWNSWKQNLSIKGVVIATLATAVVGVLLKEVIEKILLKGAAHAEVEELFGNLPLIAAGLAAAGVLIMWSGYREARSQKPKTTALGAKAAALIGMVQGICLPFRGFSRSGATISTGLLLDVEKRQAEDFSFALAVILTPPIIIKEALRFVKAEHASFHQAASGIGFFFLAMILSFFAGLLALRWLSSWLEHGRWYYFGVYCLSAAAVIFFLYTQGL